MSFSCPVCGKACRTENALIAHTEGAHGRTGVHRGALAWERYRSQEGMLTTGQDVADTFYDTQAMHEYDSNGDDVWRCPVCNRLFKEERHLERHLTSGVHEDARCVVWLMHPTRPLQAPFSIHDLTTHPYIPGTSAATAGGSSRHSRASASTCR